MKKLISCNKDHDCPDTLPKCLELDSTSPNECPNGVCYKGYCVFQTCQYCQNKWNCPTIGNLCTSGSLSGKCNANRNTCDYIPFLAIANCPPFPGKVKTALV